MRKALEGMLQLDKENHQRGDDDQDVCAEVQAAQAALTAAKAVEPVSQSLKGKGYPADWLEFADKMQAKAVEPERQPLTPDECQQIVELLDKEGHDGSDFEPECPLCTARQKLAHGITGD